MTEKGCYATFHARSAEEAIARLRKLGVDEVDIAAIDLIIIQKRWTDFLKTGQKTEQRKITQICEVAYENDDVVVNELFSFSAQTKQLVKKSEGKRIWEKIMNSFGLHREELTMEISRRAKWMKRQSIEGKSMAEFFSDVNEF